MFKSDEIIRKLDKIADKLYRNDSDNSDRYHDFKLLFTIIIVDIKNIELKLKKLEKSLIKDDE